MSDQEPTDLEKVLCRAHDIISEPRRWCRGDEAKLRDQQTTAMPESPEAYSFCSIGALKRAKHELGVPKGVFDEAIKRLAHKIEDPTGRLGYYDTYGVIADYNDGQRSKQPVLKKFCAAIKQVREEVVDGAG